MNNGNANSRYRSYPPAQTVNPEVALTLVVVICLSVAWYIAHVRLHFTHRQLTEISVYAFFLPGWSFFGSWALCRKPG
jgi:hypothetical protein